MAGAFEDRHAKPHYAGHRERLRERFMSAGAEALLDYELLELVLFRALPRQDTKPLAKALIERFKTFAEVINAPPHLLKEVKGVGDSVVTELKLIVAASERLMRGGIMDRPVLGSWSAVLDYCRATMAYHSTEVFRILFLDKKNTIIADEVQQEGTLDHLPVYPREVMKRALELSAASLVLVHNHPSGDPTPSKADIDMTRRLVETGSGLGVKIHDHIIVGRSGVVSLKGRNLI